MFIQPRLQWKTDYNATCPFSDKDICLSDSGNLSLDSGSIDSDHFGVNSSPETKFFVRTVVDCAPLRTREYAKNRTTVQQKSALTYTDGGQEITDKTDNHTLTEYFYGKFKGSAWNSTYQILWSKGSAQLPDATSDEYGFDYDLRSVD